MHFRNSHQISEWRKSVIPVWRDCWFECFWNWWCLLIFSHTTVCQGFTQKPQNNGWAAVLCWGERSEENGQTGWSWQKETGNLKTCGEQRSIRLNNNLEVDDLQHQSPHQVPLLSARNRNVRLQWHRLTTTRQLKIRDSFKVAWSDDCGFWQRLQV